MQKNCFAPPASIILLYFLASCSAGQTNKNIVTELDTVLTESNKLMSRSNENIIWALKNRADDSKTKVKAGIWLPKAEQVSRLSRLQIIYLDSLRQILQNSRADNNQSVRTLFSKNGLAMLLYQSLINYKQNLMGVDSILQTKLANEITVMGNRFNSLSQADQFEQYYFSSISRQEAIAFLSGLQNNILRNENNCLVFCMDQTAYLDGDNFSAYEAIVGQNAQILKAGDYLEITAGLGRFDKNFLPEITIGGKKAALNEKGIAVYKIKTSYKPGRYSIPVDVGFMDENGKIQTRTFHVQYSLVDAIKNH